MTAFEIATIVIVSVVFLALVAYDIVVYVKARGTGATISEIIRQGSLWFGGIPYAWGVLGGHFFWPGEPIVDTLVGMGILICIAVMGGTATVLYRVFSDDDQAQRRIKSSLLAWMILGILGGRYLWPL